MALGVDVIGVNCGRSLAENLDNLKAVRAATSLPIWMKPNAGLPHMGKDHRAVYDVTPAQMGEHAALWVAAGAQVIGGCCGTSPDHLREIADVRDVAVDDDGTVSGVVVNRSGHVLKDVRLLIDSQWLWNNETHPGEGGPGRAVFYTVQSEIPPGGQMPFTYRPESALSERPDGRYMTNVTVAGFTDITPSTTSGVSQAAPPPAYPEQ